MTREHTPGPWRWHEGDEPCHAELYPSNHEGDAVDSVAYHGSNWPMKEADKSLIAAAPEMLEALETARAFARAVDAPGSAAVYQLVTETINKATGR